MPLRSVEAATRDDAIAAAREQFGPSARVVGVRRVRSGGVLGFFATERYVAEVAPDVTNRPVVAAVTSADQTDDAPSDFSSPLASASPARARAAAPARNGAAAWAAEAARSTETSAPARSSASPFPTAARSSAPSWQAAPTAAAPGTRPEDDERVSDLASLLAPRPVEPEAPAYSRSSSPRAAFPRTERESSSPGEAPAAAPADAPDVPSPFTAALARMVAGDRDVRQAVEEALVRPGAVRLGAAAEPRPIRPERSEESPAPVRQEEETVGDQVIAPSTSRTQTTVEVPTWAAEPEVVTPPVTSREEAIAEVLRSALAQGHSDEALAGILRKVLAGVSPQTALSVPDAEPAAPSPQVDLEGAVFQDLASGPAPTFVAAGPEVTVPEFVTVESAAPEAPMPEPGPVVETPVFENYETPAYEADVVEIVEAPVFESPVVESFETPAFDVPIHEVPVTGAQMFEVPVFETRAATPDARPVQPFGIFATATPTWTPTPAWVSAPASMWDPPSMSATLWGETAAPVPATTTPIWAEISSVESEDSAAPVNGSLFAEPAEASLFAERTETFVPEPLTRETTAPEYRVEEFLPVEVVADDVVAEDVVAQQVVAEEAPVEEVAVEAVVEEPAEEVVEAVAEELAPVLARTASDPAPMMSFDSTSVMPPLSLLPPLPGSRGRGRPPVPPSPSRRSASSRSAVSPEPTSTASTAPVDESAVRQTEPSAAASAEDVWAPLPVPASSSSIDSLATVTRLPLAPLMATPEIPEQLFEPVAAPVAATPVAPATVPPSATGEVADRLVELGVPRSLLGATFAVDVAARGTYSALTRALALHLPKAPELPTGAGEVLFMVGPGIETLRAAQTLAASLRLDPDRVQWATRGDLAGLAPESSRVTTVGAAINRREDADVAGTVTIVAVDAPMRADAYWTAQMMAIWAPVAVWAVVEATRKPEDLEPWLDRLPRVDALVVQDTDLSVDPAAMLRRVDAPVALLDGGRATPHRWASLLCERLENPQT